MKGYAPGCIQSKEHVASVRSFAVESCKNLPISYAMPVFPRVTLEKGRTNFHDIWNCGIFLKFDGTSQLCVKLDKNEVHFSCRPACVSACILNASCRKIETCF
jgi:hypothetical protein